VHYCIMSSILVALACPFSQISYKKMMHASLFISIFQNPEVAGRGGRTATATELSPN
jgi:hypothetical protein